MKFGQHFEINESQSANIFVLNYLNPKESKYICTKFRGNRSRDFGFGTQKPPRKFGVKSGLSQKWLK